MNDICKALIDCHQQNGGIMDDVDFNRRFRRCRKEEIITGVCEFSQWLDEKRTVLRDGNV